MLGGGGVGYPEVRAVFPGFEMPGVLRGKGGGGGGFKGGGE